MKSKTCYGIILVLFLSFFSVSFRMGSFPQKADAPTTQPTTLNVTPEPEDTAAPDNSSPVIIPTQQGIEFNKQIINETFENNDNQWQVGKEDSFYWKGVREVKDGILSWNGVTVNSMVYTYDFPFHGDTSRQVSNVQVSTKVKLNDPKLDGYAGLIIRGHETGSWFDYYFFGIDTSGTKYSVLRSSQGNYDYLVWENEIPGVDLKNWNDLAVQAVGSHFRLFLNGNMIGEVDDATLSSGENGPMIMWNEKNQPIKIQFDDFSIKEAENVPAELLVQAPSATPEETREPESTASSDKTGPHPWSLPLYPDAQFVISDLEGNANYDAIVEKQTRNLAIEPPYSYEFYYLPTVRSFDEVRSFYKKEILKLGYSPAADLQGEGGIYLLTFVNKTSSPPKKITLQYWSSSADIMIIYKNP